MTKKIRLYQPFGDPGCQRPVSGGIGYTLQIIAQKFTDPTVASLLMSLESVFAVIAGAILLGERMTPRELLGCVIMFAAIVVANLPSSNS